MTTHDDLGRRVRLAADSQLGQLTPALLDALREILSKPLPLDTFVLDFEIDVAALRDRFAIRYDPMDEQQTQLDGGGALLPSLTRTFTEEILCNASAGGDLDPERVDLAVQQLIAWFSDCWSRASRGSSVPAFIGVHDSIHSFDLRAKKWVTLEEKWPEPPGP